MLLRNPTTLPERNSYAFLEFPDFSEGHSSGLKLVGLLNAGDKRGALPGDLLGSKLLPGNLLGGGFPGSLFGPGHCK